MKKIALLFYALVASTMLFAFDSYTDSTFLSNANIIATAGTNTSYQNWTLNDNRGFEYSGCFAKAQHSNATPEQYIQIKKFSSDPYSWVKLPDVGFPIEEITLTIGDNNGPIDSAIAYTRYIYFIKQNFPGQFSNGSALDSMATNLVICKEVTG